MRWETGANSSWILKLDTIFFQLCEPGTFEIRNAEIEARSFAFDSIINQSASKQRASSGHSANNHRASIEQARCGTIELVEEDAPHNHPRGDHIAALCRGGPVDRRANDRLPHRQDQPPRHNKPCQTLFKPISQNPQIQPQVQKSGYLIRLLCIGIGD